MESQKHLRINCAMCDIRNAAESTLSAYESIIINAGLVMTSKEIQALLPKYRVVLNAASVMEIPEGAQLRQVNGTFQILPGDIPERPVALMLNGSLEIGKGAEEALQKYVLIQVNGTVAYPDSLSEKLGMLKLNGSTECYPADAIRLKSSFVADRAFRLQARPGRYYARERVVLTDAAADPAALQEKGVRFVTRSAVVAESLAEAALPLFGEEVELQLVPDGCAYVEGGATLNEALLKRWGTKLYISGDLILTAQSEPLLPKLEYLKVLGSVQLPVQLADAFSALPAEYASLMAVKGLVVRDKVSFTLDKGLLERHPEGVTLIGCVNVKLDEDIPVEWIEERLIFRDCVNVACALNQRSAVQVAGPDVVEVSLLTDASDQPPEYGPDTQVINTADFQLL